MKLVPPRHISDGSLTMSRNIESFAWTGHQVRSDWSETDPVGHVHDAAGLFSTTYQPYSDAAWCELCADYHGMPEGPRRCRECDALVDPPTVYGEHATTINNGTIWTVEYVGVNERRCWENLPDDPIFAAIIEAGAIGPSLPDLVAMFGEATEAEMWSS